MLLRQTSLVLCTIVVTVDYKASQLAGSVRNKHTKRTFEKEVVTTLLPVNIAGAKKAFECKKKYV